MPAEWNRMAEMGPLLRKAISESVRTAAFHIQANAAATAPRDTGYLASSIYTVTSDGSTYGEGFQDGREPLPEVEKPANDLTAVVAVGAAYGVYVEYGSVHGPAQPYLTPAAEFVRPQLEKAAAALEAKMRELGGL